MTTFEADDIETIASDDPNPGRTGLAAKLRGLWSAWRAARAASKQRRLKRQFLSRLDPHLLRDVGIDPDDMRDAMKGRGPSVLFYPVHRPSKRG